MLLEQLVRSGTFRSDLYYRLNVFSIDLPPLRERKGDVLLLAAHFLRQYAPSDNVPELSAAAQVALTEYAWPGNVRELEHAILRAAAMSRTNLITPDDLGIPHPEQRCSGGASAATPRRGPYQALKREAVAAFERAYLTNLMADHGGNVTQAARTAGKDRRELAKLLKKHTLEPRSFRQR